MAWRHVVRSWSWVQKNACTTAALHCRRLLRADHSHYASKSSGHWDWSLTRQRYSHHPESPPPHAEGEASQSRVQRNAGQRRVRPPGLRQPQPIRLAPFQLPPRRHAARLPGRPDLAPRHSPIVKLATVTSFPPSVPGWRCAVSCTAQLRHRAQRVESRSRDHRGAGTCTRFSRTPAAQVSMCAEPVGHFAVNYEISPKGMHGIQIGAQVSLRNIPDSGDWLPSTAERVPNASPSGHCQWPDSSIARTAPTRAESAPKIASKVRVWTTM